MHQASVKDIAHFFDDRHERIGPGWFAEAELQTEMAAFFGQFRDYEPLLPSVQQAHSS